MAAASVLPSTRSELDLFLKGDKLGQKFHELFQLAEENNVQKKKQEKKPKKSKHKVKEKKSKVCKRDASPEEIPENLTTNLEIPGNPSTFNVYALVRQTLLEKCMKEATKVYQKSTGNFSDSETDEETDDKSKDAAVKIPKIVGLGLCGVFELVRETRANYPELCVKAMKALLDMLQGQMPESMKHEPTDVVDGLFQLLMDIATNSGPDFVHQGLSLTSLACSALISLVIALGDTGKLLTAVAALLMSTGPLASEHIKVPGILTSLQKSVQAVLQGKTHLPEWFTHGVKEQSRLFSFNLQDIPHTSSLESQGISAITSDGRYLYIHNKYGLFKIGSGYGGSLKGHIVCYREMLPAKSSVWLAYAGSLLLCRIDNSSQLCTINTDSLEVENLCDMDGHGVAPCAMFCDGEHIGQITAAKDDSFVVRMFDPHQSPMTVVNELPLKLTRKCVDAFGVDVSDIGNSERRTVCTGFDEDIASITSGKEFSLVKTTGGKVLYMGKAAALGIKQGGPSSGKWAELPITKSPKIAQIATGHDGQHALLVTEDGSVFFVGTPRRGEDGDTSTSKGRRQPKAVKPKKMIRLEAKNVIYAACNNGSSAVITKEGGLYMFGKDTAHCHQSSGHVTDLKDQIVSQISLGKAHAVALTNKGRIYTFGINNKGQCGRDFNPGASKDVGSQNVNMTEEEEEVDMESIMCPPGKHKWKLDQCMVCFVCGECTGYGLGCINSGRRKERNPGMPCGCGAGEAGCTECGACRSCAGEQLDGEDLDVDLLKGKDGPFDLAKDIVHLNLIMGGGREMKKAGPFAELLAKMERSRAMIQKNCGKLGNKMRRMPVVQNLPPHIMGMMHVFNQKPSQNKEDLDEQEAEPSNKIVSLPPQEITIGSGDIPITQISCGMHHTVVLLQNGEVYTFGSNQYGQLGVGDTVTRGSPTRVALPSVACQIASGSHHTVILLANGQVLTCGNYQKGALGRANIEDGAKSKMSAVWYTVPAPVPGVGARFGRRATWIGASGDQTYMRIDESLINAHILSSSKVFANQTTIGLIPMGEDNAGIMKCLMINKVDGNCRSSFVINSFGSGEQVDLSSKAVCLDPVYNVLWSFSPEDNEIQCYNVIAAEARCLKADDNTVCELFKPELSVPIKGGAEATRSHCALHVLGCLDTLTIAKQSNLTVLEEAKEKAATTKIYNKDDFAVVNRFENHGGGWGYSGHSIEAIRFMCDTDILLGGFGLFGGRGEYYGRIKLFELGPDGGENEGDGEVVAESEEVAFECGAREKYPMLFDEPVLLQAHSWYVALAKISGPSSDCGSNGQSVVTAEDQVVFKFKGSKKSNNGTDVNAGQIPQLLYRLPSRDNTTVPRKSDTTESALILSPDFSCTVSPENFESLLKLLEWSWNTFHSIAQDLDTTRGSSHLGAVTDLQKLVYISRACLRLLKTYINEVYPDGVLIKKMTAETERLAECVGSSQDLLRRILADEVNPNLLKFKVFVDEPPGSQISSPFVDDILDECHLTFRSCFHAFYPTGMLKWLCLCDLLQHLEPSMVNAGGYGRLLAAIMEAMCHPTIKLTNIMPINCEPQTEEILRKQSTVVMDDNTNSVARMGDIHRFPLLVDHMTNRIETSGIGRSHISFKEVLDRLLMIVSYPVRQTLIKDQSPYPSVLVANTCSLLSTIVSELAATATGLETDVTSTTRPMLVTPNRFTRTSQTAYWNTGNGSPDAIEFMVDKPGIVIAGICLYGGEGGYNYELELLDEQSGAQNADPSHTQRWHNIEIVKGSYGPDDSVNDIAEIKFDKPIPIKEGVKYAIRLRNRGFQRTFNGDGGISKVKCPDGTTFTFTACSLSSNGTNHMRGQIPQILYYSAPQEGEQHQQNTKNLAELQARKNAIDIVSAICRVATDLLHRAQSIPSEVVKETLGNSQLFKSLLPLCLAYIGPVASQDPRGAVQVLGLVQEILPALTTLINQVFPAPPKLEAGEVTNGGITPQHYAILESDHPYKPATVANYKVTFPETVKWMVVEFDPQCGTAQAEDTLQLFVPGYQKFEAPATPAPVLGEEQETSKMAYWPILRKFHGTTTWPKLSVVIPGNEVIFSLETASDYVKDEKACFYGFKCFIVGYEWKNGTEETICHLEKELSYLGGMCSSSLIKKDIMLPPVTVEELEEDMDYVEEAAQMVFGEHSQLLGKGFALSRPPTVVQALEGNLPFCWQSNERSFLKDYVSCTNGTSGCRLARWLQPDSYVDPRQCVIQYSEDDLKCSWPNIIIVLTKDQYGQQVYAPNLKVEVRAVPIDLDPSGDEYKRMRRLSRPDEGTTTFGGHQPPCLDTPYEVTIKDKKDAFHAICMMKAYENYSFEELRWAAPAVPRPSENMLVRSADDGTYHANWTPSSIGLYNIFVSIDGFETGETYKMEVKEPPKGVTPPTQSLKRQQRKQMRKFVGKNSAGLRVRTNPSLQSEQIGIVKPEGVISFMDEVHNDDGVWLRLCADSIKEWCNNGFTDAWVLQYNQHLGKTLLVPLEEPKSIIDEILNETVKKFQMYGQKPTTQPVQGGPGAYEVVKCGSFGHNIRNHPNLKATPVGRVTMGNQVNIIEEVVNVEGTWVKLDPDSVEQYCQNKDGEAWALAKSKDNTAYLLHESQLGLSQQSSAKDPFAFNTLPPQVQQGGFDFGSPGQRYPMFGQDQGTVFGNRRTSPFAFGSQSNLSVFGNSPLQPQASLPHGFGNIPNFDRYQRSEMGRTYSLPASATHQPYGNVGSGIQFSPRNASPVVSTRSPAPGSPKFSRKEMQASGLPADLQGVSVKDLVKALGQSQIDQLEWSNLEWLFNKEPSGLAVNIAGKEYRALTRAISPKKLAQLIGESQANGNGPTPVPSPPGSPKKLSRSSSPQTSVDKQGSPRSGSPVARSGSPKQSFSPARVSSVASENSNAFVTPPSSPLTTRKGQLMKEASADRPSVSPPDSPLVRHVAIEGAEVKEEPSQGTLSPRFSSPSRISPQGSPRRSGSPHVSSSPSRAAAGSPSLTGQGGEGVKVAFNIGATNKEETAGRLSPKNIRKDRGRQLRTKRERASSPSQRDLGPMSRARAFSASMVMDRPKHYVKEAMSPSVAETLRSVFAAFLWHEGIVHDAMACASFLKFNQNLTKEMSLINKSKKPEKQRERVRHATDSSKDQTKKKENINEPRVRFKIDSKVKSDEKPETHYSDSEKKKEPVKYKSDIKTVEHFLLSEKSATIEKETQLPPTLQHLVYFWDELSSATLRVIVQELVYPSPAIAIRSKKPEKKDEKKDKEKKSKKKKEVKQMGRAGIFAEAIAMGVYGGGVERESNCELCNGMFPHPVTYHMRQAHPGCGRHAGGKGYNSGGNFCDGWAGNCGEGGVGGSSWYLICDKCREKYLKEKRHAQKEKDKNKKGKKKNTLSRQQNVMLPLEPHIILKNNAMFLLDLASASGFQLPTHSQKKVSPNHDLLLPSVIEEYRMDLNPFPQVPFQYLIRQSAQSSDSAFADEFYIDADERVRSGSMSMRRPVHSLSYRPRLPTEPRHSPLARSGSLGKDQRPLSTCIPPTSPLEGRIDVSMHSAGTSPESEPEGAKKSAFQRSISEIVSDDDSNAHDKNLGRLFSPRRRNNSGGVGDGGTLLKHPSAAMTKLIGSTDKGGNVLPLSSQERALSRPVMAFIVQRHDLDGLQLAMRQALRKATCRVYALQAMNWLLRMVTQSICIHDLLWFFVSALSPGEEESDEVPEEAKDGQKNEPIVKDQKKDPKKDQEEVPVCDHPMADITIAGKAVDPLPETFHALLQSIADVTMCLPIGSVIQQMSLRCFCMKFRQSDHQFLHESHVFSNISQILSKSDELAEESNGEPQQTPYKVISLKDLTPTAEIKASSRQAMIASLTDNSTETFWESGDEDRNKLKTITITCQGQANPRIIYVHIDNTRDLGSKVSNITFNAGPAVEDMKKVFQCEVDTRHIGWINCPIPEEDCKCIQLSMRGPDHSLRVRQVKVLGDKIDLPVKKSAAQIQQMNCEAETLKVFRLLTSQVFGRLIDKLDSKKTPDTWDQQDSEPDLKEHMVGILFSRSGKLSHLQKQVCSHIVQGIKKETVRVRDEWEASLLLKGGAQQDIKSNDMFCFELVSMVTALTGSGVGRAYLAQQYGLLQDLFSLLHTASPRVQRQVLSVLRRVLPDVKPQTLANILSVPSLPPVEYSIVSMASKEEGDRGFDPQKPCILDVFLACIAKALTVQMKVKAAGPHKGITSLMLADAITEQSMITATGPRWWLRGRMTSSLANNVISLVQDMANGSLSEGWKDVTKAAIAEAILALTKLEEGLRAPQACIKTPTVWLALASLCVLNQDHVERLTSGEWVSSPNGTHGQPRPTCDNHDDGETPAIILCLGCGNLCADCDRFLHLHRSKRSHQRQVFKEEEEAIKVDLHEGCGRTKLFWIMALADSKMLKAMVEFREGKGKSAATPGKAGPGTCRFCGTTSNTGVLAIGNVCSDPDCQAYAEEACNKTLSCGHVCGGIKNDTCLPCLHRCRAEDQELLKQDSDDMCMICFTEALSAAPAILLKCGHVFHAHCARRVLENRWVGPRITFGFSHCPICKCNIDHPVLRELLRPIQQLYEDVHRKALMRLEYEGLHKADAIITPGARFYKDPAGFAMDRYAYYVCYKCRKAYYGGEARCDEQIEGGDQFDPTELVCGACSDVTMAQMCPKHGTDFLEYKCRYCCSVAVFFCFGTTHFCNLCHDNFQQVTSIPKSELPKCPCGPRGKQLEGDECPLHVKHPPTGEEFALGCGVCRNAHTF
ncbi:E3 ubiquitin-protein ligase MYCBP2-like isoform X4 [Mercenaria mercenaria]|uniref:E3 ubiquitin-protein ligase MYCBP2-like isoform X4 n=1 Tax=Mercenaria mercenaria TaxID=6596 RepID=UPI00234E5EDD|nr:E3 ubiquitin-protein ligase MYCBP2-like isoform X4 [Mercenaria mercenaria]